ncbi:LOW QUALITY PROTEIN: hypothetical protein RJ641_001823 [Dillenia turbinata]|uniref:Uncharacterized protein n=1 Tax=Dillenia turbinata TaxID=194707 RepID=A0AAN8VET2_9MAGN
MKQLLFENSNFNNRTTKTPLMKSPQVHENVHTKTIGRIGWPTCGKGPVPNVIFSLGTRVSHLNLFTTCYKKTSITIRAYSLPGHIRGPPPKGTKGNGPSPSNLEGSNLSGLRKYLESLFVA